MALFSQNWFWTALVLAGLAYFVFRGRRQGPRGIGHAALGHDHAAHGAERQGGDLDPIAQDISAAPAVQAAIDPVSGAAVRTSDALTSAYQGRIYYFASKDSRERFEASPQEFASKEPAGREVPTDRPHRRRHGC